MIFCNCHKTILWHAYDIIGKSCHVIRNIFWSNILRWVYNGYFPYDAEKLYCDHRTVSRFLCILLIYCHVTVIWQVQQMWKWVSQYRDSYCQDKMVSQLTYLYNVNPHTPKTVFILGQDPEIELTKDTAYVHLSGKCYGVSWQIIWRTLLLPPEWRHNECDAISNHQPHDCLLNCLFRRRSKKTSNLHLTGLCVGNSPVTGEFPTQRAS